MATNDLGIARRLGRGKLRESRVRSLGTKLTIEEETELATAAERKGRSASEWAREVLLREARSPKESAVFTELISMRMLLNNVLKVLATGQKITAENYQEIQTGVRTDKKRVAAEIFQQYTAPTGREQA